ncbi:MAG: transketolase C-terminal domain-containing protein [Anaerolineales bacterium]
MTTILESLNRGLRTCLEESDRVYVIGEDVLDPYGGAFKVTRGLSTDYPEHLITTPVSEAGIVGVGVGMALRGLYPVIEIMFGDFISLTVDQLINHAAKFRWMSNDQVRVPLVVRTPMGGRRGYGPTHSQSLEKHLLGAPGLRVVAATALGDAGDLLRKAVLEDDDPVLFLEHKALYAKQIIAHDELTDFEVEVRDGQYPSYRLCIAGAPQPVITLAAYGYSAELAREAVKRLAYEHEIFSDLIVPTQLSPFELDDLIAAARLTKRLLTVEEGTMTLGWGAEVIARALEELGPGFQAQRVAAVDMPVPAAGLLEKAVLPQLEDIIEAAIALSEAN